MLSLNWCADLCLLVWLRTRDGCDRFILGTDFLFPFFLFFPLPLFALFLIIVTLNRLKVASWSDVGFLPSCLFFICCRPVAEGQSGGGSSLPIMVSLPTAPPPPPVVVAPARPIASLSNRKPGVLPANLEEMKVRGRQLHHSEHWETDEASGCWMPASFPPEPRCSDSETMHK